jgi:hypothetical protein
MSHAPTTWAWPGMEQAHERGFARSIGVDETSGTAEAREQKWW